VASWCQGLEYQLQLGSCSLHKIPLKSIRRTPFHQSRTARESEPLPLKLTHDLIANASNEEPFPETKND